MKLHHLPSEFQKALPILEKIKQAGYEAYFVGGSVRDALLQRPIHDVDIATSSYPQETKSIFERTVDIGIEHGTVLVLEGGGEYEVTTFRTEDVYVDYRRPSHVTFVRSLEEDLKRRDFTVNAFALDETGQVVDLFNGLQDLDQKLLRAVGRASERFNEDALRIMRGFRFQASLGFDIEVDTRQAMEDCAPLLSKISIERIFIEFDKLLLAPYFRKGLRSFQASRAYHYLPEMTEGDTALTKLLESLGETSQFSSSEQAWAALILAMNLPQARPFLKKWKTSNDFQKKVEQLVEIYRLRDKATLGKWDCYRFDLDLMIEAEALRQMQGLPVDFQAILDLHQSLSIHDKQEMAVNGRILMMEYGFQAGPQLGQILNQIEQAIVEDHLENQPEAIREFIKEQGYE
ncbi:CCA tRNA nucleotidyltransferase [Streptococcus himalayensis]|uniref:CCA-adding enzyme n=1 Tax=Streptococcus himalayensis TaxID=1888195 RepID=A0A917A9Z5_9STRE|nr:CCA tRNA nucleotidyltransferase [Streptococcus himalayensis]GGE35865.1 CCA-adding enzyme [Streptococcus himalayensis]